jgi:hypothetical protein
MVGTPLAAPVLPAAAFFSAGAPTTPSRLCSRGGYASFVRVRIYIYILMCVRVRVCVRVYVCVCVRKTAPRNQADFLASGAVSPEGEAVYRDGLRVLEVALVAGPKGALSFPEVGEA